MFPHVDILLELFLKKLDVGLGGTLYLNRYVFSVIDTIGTSVLLYFSSLDI